jgi:hypothetical protein
VFIGASTLIQTKPVGIIQTISFTFNLILASVLNLCPSSDHSLLRAFQVKFLNIYHRPIPVTCALLDLTTIMLSREVYIRSSLSRFLPSGLTFSLSLSGQNILAINFF